jgi:hypothetical protein
MKYRRLAALLAFATVAVLARAQDEETKQRPPTEIPDFSNLDEYIYEPKSKVQLSFRHLSGAKTQFFGKGAILAPEVPALPDWKTNPSLDRVYHDGSVSPDKRSALRVDQGGNVITDPQANNAAGDTTPDGRTNSWSYTDYDKQVAAAPLGYIAFHSYSAEITDANVRRAEGRSTNGMDLAVLRDMGKIGNSRFSWNLVGGMSVNDINARRIDFVKARVKTVTEYYSTFGQNIPTGGYTSPTSTPDTAYDNNGTPVTLNNSGGITISNLPVASVPSESENTTAVQNNWKVKGAYFTFRGGPELVFPITTRLHVTVSAGLALIYSGTNYTVTQVLTPDVGSEIQEVDTNAVYKLRPGYFADATLGFDLTEKAEFFAGGVFQSAQGYTQELHTTTAQYATKIDLTNQSGFRAGMSIRF